MADKDANFRRRFGGQLRSMEISLSAAVVRTSATLEEMIDKMRVAGMDDAFIKSSLERDLASGGRVFGEFRRAVQATTEGTIGSISTDAYLEEFGTDLQFTWIAALVNTCEDCLPRHGVVKDFSEWEAEGLPRTGWSVCRGNCQCVLIPEKIATGRNELRGPLDRKTAMAERRAAKAGV